MNSGSQFACMSGSVRRQTVDGLLYGFLTRLGPAVFFFLVLLDNVYRLSRLINQPHFAVTHAEFYARAAASISTTLFLSLVVTLFLIRKPPVGRAQGIRPRLTAIVGTFLMYLLVLLPAHTPSVVQSSIGLALVCIGSGLSVIAIAKLGTSFSIMAEARELVTTGPYSVIRHPLYVAEEIAVLGVIVQNFSVLSVLLLIAHSAIQFQRMKNEERILKRTFPEYEPYMARTYRVIPGLY